MAMCNYQRYEQLKKEWIQANPNATNQEYQAAMRRIAAKCGV
jgi:t-SNARE complex subunit (syntaxin)